MEAVATRIPPLLPLVVSAYAENSILQFGEFEIISQEGVQQGDPLGPLLFSLTVAGVLDKISSEFVAAYLDDITIGDIVENIVQQVAEL